jgi:D-alanyl-D-alanine carboxypeptidase
MFNAIYCFILIAVCSISASPQDTNATRLDSLFSILSEKKNHGSAVIFKNGKIVYRKAFGHSIIQDSIKKISTDSTKYRVGSITKTFTATMIFSTDR